MTAVLRTRMGHSGRGASGLHPDQMPETGGQAGMAVSRWENRSAMGGGVNRGKRA